MNIFEDIKITWGGKDYFISGDDKIMVLIAKIENHMSINELKFALDTGEVKMTTLCKCCFEILSFAGVKCTQAEIYSQLMLSPESSDKANFDVTSGLTAVISVFFPETSEDKNQKNVTRSPTKRRSKGLSSKK